MELEKLKEEWNVLNEHLAQNEILNKRIVKEMITTRALSAYERLWRSELWSLFIVILVGTTLFPYSYYIEQQLKPATFVLCETTLLYGLIVQFIQLYNLSRMNIGKKQIKGLRHHFLKYEKIRQINNVLFPPLVITIITIAMIIEKTYLFKWAIINTVIGLIIGAMIACFLVQAERRNIREIEKGLDELKEFGEE